MLSEDVLEQLAGRTDAAVMVLATAWPSLDVACKLQVLQFYQRGPYSDAPDGLFLIAARDPEPIVRYWACRYRNLPTGERRPLPDAMAGLEDILRPADDMVQAADELRADTSPLVAAAARGPRHFMAVPPDDADRTTMLLFLRDARDANLSTVVDWLERVARSGRLSDGELIDVFWEFVESKWLLSKLRTDRMSEDGFGFVQNLNTGKKLWEMTKSLPLGAANQIAGKAPIVVEKSNVVAEIFGSLPGQVQKLLMWRDDLGADKLKEIVLAAPGSYPDAADELESRGRNDYIPDEDAIERRRLEESPDKQAVLLKMVADLAREVASLREQVTEAATRKRGLFG